MQAEPKIGAPTKAKKPVKKAVDVTKLMKRVHAACGKVTVVLNEGYPDRFVAYAFPSREEAHRRTIADFESRGIHSASMDEFSRAWSEFEGRAQAVGMGKTIEEALQSLAAKFAV